MDERFALALVPYIILGSVLRVLEDAGFFSEPVGYLMISPLIYIMVGLFTILMVALSLFISGTAPPARDGLTPGERPWVASLPALMGLILYGGYCLLYILYRDQFSRLEHPLVMFLPIALMVLFLSRKSGSQLSPAPSSTGGRERREGRGRGDTGPDAPDTIEPGVPDATVPGVHDTTALWIPDAPGPGEPAPTVPGTRDVHVPLAPGTPDPEVPHPPLPGPGDMTGRREADSTLPVPADTTGPKSTDPGGSYHLYLHGVGWTLTVMALAHLCRWGWDHGEGFRPLVIPGALILATAAWYVTMVVIRGIHLRWGLPIEHARRGLNSLMVFSQFFDAAATYLGIEFYGYREKHVIPSFLIDLTGTAAVMFPLKCVVLALTIYLLDIEYRREMEAHPGLRGMIKIVVIILGLAPGTRNILRLAFGT